MQVGTDRGWEGITNFPDILGADGTRWMTLLDTKSNWDFTVADNNGQDWDYIIFPDRKIRSLNWGEHANVAQIKAYIAAYTPVDPKPTYALTLNTPSHGSIAKLPDAATYDSATVVNLTATPAARYEFSGWSGSITGTANPTTITMNAAKSVTATFIAKVIEGVVMPSGTGTVFTVTNDTVFYDDGGKNGLYSQLYAGVLTFTPGTAGNAVSLDFDTLNLEGTAGGDIYDSILIYDGTSTSAELIGVYSGTVNPGVITSTTGSLTVRFVSDEGGEYVGWAANVSMAPLEVTPTGKVASALYRQTGLAYQGSRLVFTAGSGITIRFFTPNGRMIRSINCPAGESSIDAASLNLPAGLYLAQATASDRILGSVRCMLR